MMFQNQKNKELYDKIILLIYRNEIEKVRDILEKIGKYINFNKDIKTIIEDISGKLDLLNRFVIEGDSIYLYIINPCDYKCIFCDRSEEKMRKVEKNNYTNIGNIKFIIGLLEFNGTLNKYNSFDIGGHEPLANENILEIFKYLSGYNKQFIIHTSGSRPDILEKILMLGFDIKKVIIPIYSLKENNFNIITNNKNGFSNYNKCIEILKKGKISYFTSTILIKDNQDEIELFNKYWYSLLIPNNFNTINLYKKNGVKFGNYIKLFKKLNKEAYVDNFSKKHYTQLPICILYNISEEYYNELIKNGFDGSYKEKIQLNKHSEMKKLQDKNREYIKPEICKKCIAFKICSGYYRIHFEVFGEQEVLPILE